MIRLKILTISSQTIYIKAKRETKKLVPSRNSTRSNVVFNMNNVWKANQMPDGSCIIAISNYGNRNLTLNWIASLRRNNYTRFVIFCLDRALFEFLTTRGLDKHAVIVPSEWITFNVSLEPQAFLQGQFRQMMQSRVLIWYQLLSRSKKFLACDTDVVFTSPHVYTHVMFAYERSLKEIIFQVDSLKRELAYNTGFFFASATDFVKNLMRETLNELREDPSGENATDQRMVNKILAEKYPGDERVGSFDHFLYATGSTHFFDKLNNKTEIRALVVHANCLLNIQDKISSLKKAGLWFLDENGTML